MSIYLLLLYQLPLEQTLIFSKIREYTNNTKSGGSTFPTQFFDPSVLVIFFGETIMRLTVILMLLKLHMSDTLSS